MFRMELTKWNSSIDYDKSQYYISTNKKVSWIEKYWYELFKQPIQTNNQLVWKSDDSSNNRVILK